MTLVQNIKTFIKSHSIQGTKATWGLFVLFALILFLKNVLFHWFAFHSILVSSLWKQPLAFFLFYLSKGAIAIFISSFVFITKRKWWVIIVSFILDIWIISCLVYYRANGIFPSVSNLEFINNLSGFTSSISMFFSWQYTIFPILTLLLLVAICFTCQYKSISKKTIFFLLFLLVCYYIKSHFDIWYRSYFPDRADMAFYRENNEGWKRHAGSYGIFYFIPFSELIDAANTKGMAYCPQYKIAPHYIRGNSIIHYLFGSIIYDITYACTSRSNNTTLNIPNSLFGEAIYESTPQYNLVLIIIESFENWVIEKEHICHQSIMPNIHKLLSASNTLWIHSITSQALQGVSMDGQQIINTGLLPISKGVTISQYSDNTFPNIAHLYQHSLVISPTNTWGQDTMSIRFGYSETLLNKTTEPLSLFKHEKLTFDQFNVSIDTISEPYIIQLLTVASHCPFKVDYPTLDFPSTMPQYMQDYLRCLHYTDSCFGVWYNEWKETEQAKNTVLVITGDHTIFKDAMLQEFKPYAQQAGLSIASGKTYCPLIIQAPQIEENIQITDICYQMDVYPTIMHLIGCEDYYWKGFGVNLLDSTARHNRPITEEQAYQLSDKLIRADYFKDLQQ